ncbi:MAG TPA: hypothetical protein VIC26_01385 [Marinagarivorans sp.]
MKRIILAIMAALPLVVSSVEASAGNFDKGAKKEINMAAKDAAKHAKKDAKEAIKKAKKDAKAAAKQAKKDAKAATKQAKKDAKNGAKDKKGKKAAHSVPEIDAAGAALAIGLLGGIAAIRRERKKKAAL